MKNIEFIILTTKILKNEKNFKNHVQKIETFENLEDEKCNT